MGSFFSCDGAMTGCDELPWQKGALGWGRGGRNGREGCIRGGRIRFRGRNLRGLSPDTGWNKVGWLMCWMEVILFIEQHSSCSLSPKPRVVSILLFMSAVVSTHFLFWKVLGSLQNREESRNHPVQSYKDWIRCRLIILRKKINIFCVLVSDSVQLRSVWGALLFGATVTKSAAVLCCYWCAQIFKNMLKSQDFFHWFPVLGGKLLWK